MAKDWRDTLRHYLENNKHVRNRLRQPYEIEQDVNKWVAWVDETEKLSPEMVNTFMEEIAKLEIDNPEE